MFNWKSYFKSVLSFFLVGFIASIIAGTCYNIQGKWHSSQEALVVYSIVVPIILVVSLVAGLVFAVCLIEEKKQKLEI